MKTKANKRFSLATIAIALAALVVTGSAAGLGYTMATNGGDLSAIFGAQPALNAVAEDGDGEGGEEGDPTGEPDPGPGTVEVDSVVLNVSDTTYALDGEGLQITATALDSESQPIEEGVTWEWSVTENATITSEDGAPNATFAWSSAAKGGGTATVTATAGEKSKSVTITAIDASITDVVVATVDEASAVIEQGGSAAVQASVLPEGSSQLVTWAVTPADSGVTIEGSTVSAAADAAVGDYSIVATSTANCTKSGAVTITVTEKAQEPAPSTDVTVSRVTITDDGSNNNAAQGAKVTLKAVALDEEEAEVTEGITWAWAVSPEGAATIADGEDGAMDVTVDADAELGSTVTVTATVKVIETEVETSANYAILVIDPEVDHVSISADNAAATLDRNGELQLAASVQNAENTETAVQDVIWSITPEDQGVSIDAAGKVTASEGAVVGSYMAVATSVANKNVMQEFPVTVVECLHDWVDGEAKEANCTDAGYTPQTCSKCNATQHKPGSDVEADGVSHDYEGPEWAWEDDASAATATWTCKHNGEHTAVETTTPSLIEGTTTYTATVTFGGKDYTNTKTFEVTEPDEPAEVDSVEVTAQGEPAPTTIANDGEDAVTFKAVAKDAEGTPIEDAEFTWNATYPVEGSEDAVLELTVATDTASATLTVPSTVDADTVITVTAACSGKTASQTITVVEAALPPEPPAPEVSVAVTPKTVTVPAGGSQYLKATVTMTGESQGVVWTDNGTSENTYVNNVAPTEENGYCNGELVIGTDETADSITVAATSIDDIQVSDTATVTVLYVEVNPGVIGAPSVEQGTELTLTTAVYPESADQSVTWSLAESYEGIQIDENGVLAADMTAEPGTVTVYATTAAGKVASYDVTVVEHATHIWNEDAVTQRATCTEPGKVYKTCIKCDEINEIETLEIDPDNHDYTSEPSWNWAEDCSTATATVACSRDASHDTHVVVVPTDGGAISSDNSVPGQITYTASIIIEGHLWTNPKVVEVASDEPLVSQVAAFVKGTQSDPQTVIEVEKGASAEFEATVDYDKDNDSPQGVNWAVSGALSSGSEITSSDDANAVVSVAADETAAQFAVTATSIDKPYKTASVTIKVIDVKIDAVTVASEGNATSIDQGGTLQFSATVTPVAAGLAASQDVYWSVDAPSDGVAKHEETGISINGLLTVSNHEQNSKLIVTAKSVADQSKVGTFEVDVNAVAPEVASVTISPTSKEMAPGSTQQFTATVTGSGDYDETVSWDVVSVPAGTKHSGTTVVDGLLTISADETSGTLVVTATSNGDATKDASATITVTIPHITSIEVIPDGGASTVTAGSTLAFRADVQGTGPFTAGVKWSLASAVPGATIGEDSGLLSVSDSVAVGTKITVVATSTMDNSWSDSYEVEVTAPLPIVTSVTVTPNISYYKLGEGPLQFSADVQVGNSATSTDVDWSVSGAATGQVSINAAGLLTIDNRAQAESIVVTATAKDDPSKSDSVSFTLIGLEINPDTTAAPAVETGKSVTLTAAVYGESSQAVNWEITSAVTSSKTSIASDGVLSVGDDETATAITVKATSAVSGASFKTASIAVNVIKHIHNWVANGEVVAATCTTGGYTPQKCSKCGKEANNNETGPDPSAHTYSGEPTWGTWTASHTVTATFTCENDSSHTTTVNAVVSSSAESDKIVYTATVVFGGTTYTNPVTDQVAIEPNPDPDPDPNPNPDPNPDPDPDEPEPPAQGDCPNGGDHSWSAFATTVPASCTTDGVKTSTCSKCNEKKTETIKATGHDMVKDKVVAPTCTADGYTVYKCKNSGCAVTENRDATAKLAHEFTKTVTHAKEASCTEDGATALMKCAHCEATDGGKVIPKLGHDLVDTTVAATCEEDGTVTHKCSRCDYEADPTVLKKTGHNWGDPVWKWNDDKSAATATFTCKKDGDHVTEIDAQVFNTEGDNGSIKRTADAILDGKTYTDVIYISVSGDKTIILRGEAAKTGLTASFADAPDGDVELIVDPVNKGKVYNALLKKTANGKANNLIGIYSITMMINGKETHTDFGELIVGFPVDVKHAGKNVLIHHCHQNDTSNITSHKGFTVDDKGKVNVAGISDLSTFAIELDNATIPVQQGVTNAQNGMGTATPNGGYVSATADGGKVGSNLSSTGDELPVIPIASIAFVAAAIAAFALFMKRRTVKGNLRR